VKTVAHRHKNQVSAAFARDRHRCMWPYALYGHMQTPITVTGQFSTHDFARTHHPHSLRPDLPQHTHHTPLEYSSKIEHPMRRPWRGAPNTDADTLAHTHTHAHETGGGHPTDPIDAHPCPHTPATTTSDESGMWNVASDDKTSVISLDFRQAGDVCEWG
jgi:hypothetical protein